MKITLSLIGLCITTLFIFMAVLLMPKDMAISDTLISLGRIFSTAGTIYAPFFFISSVRDSTQQYKKIVGIYFFCIMALVSVGLFIISIFTNSNLFFWISHLILWSLCCVIYMSSHLLSKRRS